MGAAITGAPADKNDAGLVSFDDTMFTVDANGYVQLVGGDVGIDSLTGDDGVAVGGDAAGNVNITGSVVANATNAKPLYFDGDAGTFTQTLELQVATTLPLAPADTNDAGICSFNSAQFSVDANGFVTLAGGSAAIDSNTGDDGVTIFPDVAGNFNWIGETVANATHAKPVFFKDSATANALDLDVQVGAAITGAPPDKNDAGLVSFDNTAFAVNTNGYVTMIGGLETAMANFIVDTNGTRAEYTTLASAFAAASAGDTIGIKPGTYTENIAITKDISIVALGFSWRTDDNISPVIRGKFTVSAGIKLKLSGLDLQTNGGNIVDCSAAGARAYLSQCQCTIENAVTAFAIGDSTSAITLLNCYGLGTGTAQLFAATAGVFSARYCWFESLGANSTTATNACLFQYCNIEGAGITTSGTGFLVAEYCHFGSSIGTGTNTTWLTASGSTSRIEYCRLLSGTATCIVVNSGIVACKNSNLSSSNVAVVSGAGSFNYNDLIFEGTSSAITATTQNVGTGGPSRTIGSANIGGSNILTTLNTDNTNSSSDAAIIASVGGSSGGEAYFSTSKTGTGSWAHGFKAGLSSTYFFSRSTSNNTTPDSGTEIVAINQNGSTTISGQADGSSTDILFQNINNTASSSVNLALQSAGSTAGDAWIRFKISGAGEYSLGVDNSDSDALCLTNTSTLNGTNYMRVSSAGEFNYFLQPAFLAVNSVSDTNQTGAGTTATVEFDTEIYDQGGNFNNTTDTFTAPVTGRYLFNISTGLGGLSGLMTQLIYTLVTSNRTYQIEKCNPFVQADGTNTQFVANGSVIADMDAADTALVQVKISNGAGDTASIIGGNNNTFFSGCLLV